MEPIHVVSDPKNISELVLMPGDPLRAKYIAENFLSDAILINDTRNMLGYTGYYKNTKITVIGSGMGIPSIGIYAYELIHFYGVKKIIRVGTAGALLPSVHVRDIIIGTEARSMSTFALSYSGDESYVKFASNKLIENIKSCTQSDSIKYGPIWSSDVFDPYTDIEYTKENIDIENVLASEMEAFGLYHIGEITQTDVLAILTITNSKFTPNEDLTKEEREKTLNEMITLALEAVIK